MIDTKLKEQIDSMSREAMASKWWFAPVGDPLLAGEVGDYFSERFKALGGFSPEINKKRADADAGAHRGRERYREGEGDPMNVRR